MMVVVLKLFFPIIVLLVFKSSCYQAENAVVSKKYDVAKSDEPINININTKKGCTIKGIKGDKGEAGRPCNCSFQVKKPSAHIEGPTARLFKYNPNSDIKTWTATAPNAHVTGGMSYRDGKLTIPSPGHYYVYAQAYFTDGANKYKRIFVLRNGNAILLTQPSWYNRVSGTGYTGGVFRLQAGDVISVRVKDSNTGINMNPAHTFFGAFLI